ncbi:MAG TPA: CBS domain-containing protein, partial [Candidatus Binatia bacterium]
TLTKNRISGVPVTDKSGKMLGIVSRTDIVAKNGAKVKDIMSTEVIKVSEETPVEEIANLITTYKINRVPVLTGKKLAGIVSRADIVRAIAMGKHIALHTPIYDL